MKNDESRHDEGGGKRAIATIIGLLLALGAGYALKTADGWTAALDRWHARDRARDDWEDLKARAAEAEAQIAALEARGIRTGLASDDVPLFVLRGPEGLRIDIHPPVIRRIPVHVATIGGAAGPGEVIAPTHPSRERYVVVRTRITNARDQAWAVRRRRIELDLEGGGGELHAGVSHAAEDAVTGRNTIWTEDEEMLGASEAPKTLEPGAHWTQVHVFEAPADDAFPLQARVRIGTPSYDENRAEPILVATLRIEARDVMHAADDGASMLEPRIQEGEGDAARVEAPAPR